MESSIRSSNNQSDLVIELINEQKKTRDAVISFLMLIAGVVFIWFVISSFWTFISHLF